MSQDDVLRWLTAHPGWHRPAEISTSFGGRRSAWAGKPLKVLAARGEVMCRKCERGNEYSILVGDP